MRLDDHGIAAKSLRRTGSPSPRGAWLRHGAGAAETGARQAARAAAVRAAWHLGRGRGTLRDEAADSGSTSHGRPEDRAGRARRRGRLVANISRAWLLHNRAAESVAAM